MDETLLEHRLKTLETRANDHSKRLDTLETGQATVKEQIKALCKEINSLSEDIKDFTGILKWLVGISLTSLIGFFVYAVQQGVFK